MAILLLDLLVQPAEEAGIKVPDDPRDYDPDEYPHWHVYTAAQLGQSMPDPAAHWDNARVVAAVPDGQIRKVTGPQLVDLGFRIGRPIP